MKEKKTLVKDFIEYLDSNRLGSVRVKNAIKSHFWLSFHSGSDYFIEDIPDNEFMKFRNAGKKSLSDYKMMKERYLPLVKKKEIIYVRKDEDGSRIKYECLLHQEVIDALDSIYNEKHFVEQAILEKLERDGIKPTKPSNPQFPEHLRVDMDHPKF